jgi:two-component system KDP operon response regulator KdpE
MARVRVGLRKSFARETLAKVVHVGEDIRIDMERRIVEVRGKEVHLTPIEHRFLAALVRQAGRVVTYRQLLEQVWGPGHEQRVSSMRVCMAALRHKLERVPARPEHLMTETGVGYRLRLEA